VTDSSPIRRFFAGLARVLSAIRVFLANLLFVVLLLVVMGLLFGGPARVHVPDGAALLVAPEGDVVEQPAQFAPLGQLIGPSEIARETSFHDLATALRGAKDDARIRMVVLDLDEMTGISPAHLQALGEAIAAVRAAGKRVVAVGDAFSQGQYFLASFADSVYLHPMGQVLLEGFASYQVYFKDALERLKVNVHVFRVGTYKAAVEPFTRSSMSEEARLASQTLVDELWEDYLAAVAPNRKLEPVALDRYVEEFPALLDAAHGDLARLALEQGLVDELIGRDEMRTRLIGEVGEHEGDFLRIDARQYAAALRESSTTSGKPAVGVVIAAGTIQSGEQPRGTIGADTLTDLVRQARLDADVRAIVLRVDSPGGSAFASEVIRQELELLQVAGKPLVVSMAGAAASGGYWISATADEIWAAPSTVTGSIGIFGLFPTFEGSLDALGVHRDGVGSTALAGGLDPFGGLSEPMSRIVQANVENGYSRFLNLVARGRNMQTEEVDKVGQGRVWSGRHATALGLVDQIGHLDDAIAAAAKRAGLDDYAVRFIEKPLSPRDQLLAELADSLGLAPSSEVAWLQRWWAKTLAGTHVFDDPGHVYSVCGECRITLR
jgi:protease-4